ncbi:hypothetical protein LSCM1_02837 [Leishmania martiniquensis]|uniref:RanBP2-type domain-containing protein n=1 Tax=Leishmania martiniquensis TaxID=1580590 RepID=A0A836GPW0_9TRYP|nr:hypothetical protein LSCM1_02837 [Leishmania martiniquensis]
MLQLRGLACVRWRAVQRFVVPVFCTDRRYVALAPGKWKCGCGLHNFDFHLECYGCHEKRTDLPDTKHTSPLSLLSDMRLDDDDAAEEHYSSTARDNVHLVEGVWMCPACYTFNGAVRVACMYCRETRSHLQLRKAADERVDHHANGFEQAAAATSTHLAESETAAAAGAGFSSARSGDSVPSQPFKKGDWYCVCGAHNFSRNTHCLKCHAPRASSKSEAEAKGLPGNQSGDWTCPECEMYNFSWRKVCKRCNRALPTDDGAPALLRKAAATTAKTASGWVCEVCHSLNPAEDAAMCAICGSPMRA